MSSLREKCDQAAEMAKGLKDDRVADYHGEDRDEVFLHPIIEGWRGDDWVVTMIPMQVDRDQALRAAWICAQGFGCDSMAFTTDAWSATTRANPVTGKPWGEREMQDVVVNHDGLGKGWITEGLGTHAVNRAGDLAGTYQRFTTMTRRSVLGIVSWSLEWTERRTTGLGGEARSRTEGMITDNLVRYMNMTTTGQAMASLGITGRDFGLDDVEAQAHADCAVVKTLRLAGFEGAVMLRADDDRRQAIIEASLGHLRMR